MRTTLTIDLDAAAMREQLQKKRGTGLKELINEALRRGLREIAMRLKLHNSFRARSVDLGHVRVGSVDNIAEVPAIAEGEGSA